MAENDNSDPKTGEKDLPDILAKEVEAMEVHILILAKHPHGQAATAAFLSKRGWPTTVTGSVSEALNLMVKDRPDVVLISFNHPHPSIPKMPESLTQTFNLTSIGFLETADEKAADLLAKTKMLFKLQGPPSGSNIQRIIRKMMIERLMPIVQLKMNEEVTSNVGHNPRKKKPYVMEVGEIKKKMRVAPTMLGLKSSRIAEEQLDDKLSNEILVYLNNNLLTEEDEKFDAVEVKEEPTVSQVTEQERLKHQSILEQALETSLKSKSPDQKVFKKEKLRTNRVAVVTVESPTIHGYLVVCPTVLPEKQDESKFLNTIKHMLDESFSSLKVPGELESVFWVDISEVEFNQWTSEKSLFQIKAPVDGQEFTIAYFPTEKPIAKAEKTDLSDLLAVKAEDVPTDAPVPFKMYLNLPASGRSYLYLRNGRTLQPEQKARLANAKTPKLFIKTEDLDQFKTFMASIHLNSLAGKKKAS